MMKEPCNTGRQLNIDVAKCYEIVAMILVHSLVFLGVNVETGFGYVADLWIGGFMGAPVFVVCMGVGIAYSRNNTPKAIISRGAFLLLAGYILNFLRTTPLALSFFLRGLFMEHLEQITTLLLAGDIFQFAGLALIFFGILRHIKLRDISILILSIIFSLCATMIPTLRAQGLMVSEAAGLVILFAVGKFPAGSFPLATWFIFVAFGYWFGNKLRNIKNLDRFYLTIAFPCLVICIIGVLFEYRYGINMMKDELGYHHMILTDAVLCLCYCMFSFSFLHFVSKLFSLKLKTLCMTMSNALNIIYLIHWVLVACIMAIVAERHIPLLAIIGIALFVLVISTWLGIRAKKAIHDHPKKFQRSILRYL